MKKILLIIATLLFVIILASCGGTELDLSQYKVVIPENADATVRYASENFVEAIEDRCNITLPIIEDGEPETEYEILIGETNREASKTNTSLEKNQYLLIKKGNKLVFKGEGIYIGAPCGAFLNEYSRVKNESLYIKNIPTEETLLHFEFSSECKNVIFMIGDGMGENHIKLAEKNGLDEFVARQFPSIGLSVTRSQSVINGDATYTDSAASGTAMSTGYKTINGYIGLDKDGYELLNVRELAYSNGAKTAVVTTDKITGATPSAYLCHNISRYNTEELQAEIDALIADGKVDYCKGEVDNNLTIEAKNALSEISKDGSQFFIMIEEAYIDKNSHKGDKEGALNAVIRFDDAIEYATQFTFMHPNTALIVTADHETGKLTESTFHAEGFTFLSSNHTNVDVPIFALGANTQCFNEARIENIELAKFTARAYSKTNFGQAYINEP